MHKLILKIVQALLRLLKCGGGCCADLLVIGLALFLAAGCLSNSPAVTSGQHLTIGLWVPLADGQTFGLQFLDYLQGSKFVGTTNCTMEVEHRTASTNEYFSIVRTKERVEDKAKIK